MPLIKCHDTAIGSRKLNGNMTEVAVSVFDKDADSFINSFTTGRRKRGTLYEIRYDLFQTRNRDELGIIIAFLEGMQADYIFTFRSENEKELSDFYGLASDLQVKCADIEVSVYDSLKGKVKFETLMLSHHSYSGESMAGRYSDILRYDPSIIKLASEYKSYESFQEDFLAIQDLKKMDGRCLSFIPMGKRNSFLRVVSAYVVSDIVYAKEDEGTAEGQFTEEDYRRFFSSF